MIVTPGCVCVDAAGGEITTVGGGGGWITTGGAVWASATPIGAARPGTAIKSVRTMRTFIGFLPPEIESLPL